MIDSKWWIAALVVCVFVWGLIACGIGMLLIQIVGPK